MIGFVIDLHRVLYCYTNDFARWCRFINRGGHTIQPPRLMPAINGGWYFFIYRGKHFLKLIYKGRCIKKTAFKKSIFLEVVVLKQSPL